MKKKKCCSNCVLSRCSKGNSILSSGYICYKNPFKPKPMGLCGSCGSKIK